MNERQKRLAEIKRLLSPRRLVDEIPKKTTEGDRVVLWLAMSMVTTELRLLINKSSLRPGERLEILHTLDILTMPSPWKRLREAIARAASEGRKAHSAALIKRLDRERRAENRKWRKLLMAEARKIKRQQQKHRKWLRPKKNSG